MWQYWLFVVNAAIEGGAGLVSLLNPNIMPTFSKLQAPQGLTAVRWWSAAVLALAVTSFFLAAAPDTEKSKQGFAAGMGLYHLCLTLMVLKEKDVSIKIGALLVHLPLTLAFGYFLYLGGGGLVLPF
ncbi:hypothetical protein QOT17_012200 [Balamuthia mandrillaris]